jgi:putative phosphoribosyl transferase
VAYEVAVSPRCTARRVPGAQSGVPAHEELAIRAIASRGVRVLNEDLVQSLRIPLQVVDHVAAEEQHELTRLEHLY